VTDAFIRKMALRIHKSKKRAYIADVGFDTPMPNGKRMLEEELERRKAKG